MEIVVSTKLDGVLPERIEFNYDELKKELDERLLKYSSKDKTDATNYKERKADRARLNELARALNDDRKNLKNTLLAPITNGTPDNMSYSDKIDDLIGMVKMVVGEIDNGIKEYEDGLRERKREDITAFFKSHWVDAFSESNNQVLINSKHWSNFAEEQMNRKRNAWLNATCDDEYIRSEIRAEVSRCVNAYMLICTTYKDEDELTKTKALDALSVKFDTADAMQAVESHKAQVAAAKKRDEERKRAEEASMANKVVLSEPIQPGQGAKPSMYSCTMKFVGSMAAFNNLKEYLEMNKDITYTVVEKMAEIEQ